MGSTPNYSWPYPALGDAPDGATQIQALAAAIDTTLAAQIANLQSQINGIAVPVSVFKTGITTRTVTTRSIDPDLQVTLAASSKYQVIAGIVYSGSVAMTFGWTAPAGNGGGYAAGFNMTGTGEVTENETWAATPSAGAVDGGLTVTGMISTGTTSGLFGFNWASTVSGTGVAVGAGSILTVQKVG